MERLSAEQLKSRAPGENTTFFVDKEGVACYGYVHRMKCEKCKGVIAEFFNLFDVNHTEGSRKRSWMTGTTPYTNRVTGGSAHKDCIPKGATVRHYAGGN